MRAFLALLLIAAAPQPAAAPAGDPPVLETLHRAFPDEHAALAARLAGAPPAARPTLVWEAMHRFGIAHSAAVGAAPTALLVALERRHAAMLRALETRDVALCARVGNHGFFGAEARAAAPPPGIDDYAVALVEAAAAGAGRPAPQRPAREDLDVWLAAVNRRAPDVPMLLLLRNPARRAAATPHELCSGAAATHEALAALRPDQAARIAPMLVRAVLDQDAAGGR